MNYRRARMIAVVFIVLAITAWRLLTNDTAHGYLLPLVMAFYCLLEGSIRHRS